MGTPVTWEAKWQSPLADYLTDYRSLIGDQRTAVTFGEVVQGIIGAGSWCANESPRSRRCWLGAGWWATGQPPGNWREHPAFAVGCRTSDGALRQRGVAQLANGTGTELWLIADGSELRKPYAQAMPALMQVRDLDGDLVPAIGPSTCWGCCRGDAACCITACSQAPLRTSSVSRVRCSRHCTR